MELQEILKKIQETNLNHTFTSWSPTLQKDVVMTGLTNGHQQTFVQNLLNSPYVNSPFIISLAQAIGECWQDSDPFDPSKLTILDKAYFMISLWANSYNNPKTQEIRSQKLNQFEHPEDIIISNKNYKFILNYPSILKEAQFADFTHKWTNENLKAENPESLTNLRSMFYLLEPLVYVKNMTISDMELDMSQITVEDQMPIVKGIPMDVIQEITNVVEKKFNPLLDKARTVSINKEETVLKLNNTDFIITNQE